MAITTNTTPAPAATINLADLIASHRAMMVAHEALYDAEDDDATDAQDILYKKLLASRRDILDRRPHTLDEVRAKAELMMGDKAFVWWDVDGVDVEEHFPAVLASLIPVAPEAEGIADAA